MSYLLSPIAVLGLASALTYGAYSLAVTAPKVPVEAEVVTSAVKLDIPVAWQLTKARIVGNGGATTMTESFRETWTLEQRSGGYLYMQSPRATVPVFLPGGVTLKPGITPVEIVLVEPDLARLVGISSPGATDDAGDPIAPAGPSTPVTLKLGKPARGGTDVTLAWSDDEHYAVHIDVDNSTLF